MSEMLRNSPKFEKFSLMHKGAQIEVSPAPYGVGSEIEVIIPKDHKFPSQPEGGAIQPDQLLEEAEPVASFQDSLDSIVNSSFGRGVQEAPRQEHVSRIDLGTGFKKWVIRENLPKSILEILAHAIAHESLLRKEPSAVKVEIRLQNADSSLLLHNSPHFDSSRRGDNLSIYLLSSPPTSIQYEGEFKEGLRDKGVKGGTSMSYKSGKSWANQESIASRIYPSSLMPWTLFRITGRSLHSTPWESPGSGDTAKDRLFMRIFFVYSS